MHLRFRFNCFTFFRP